MVVKLRDVLVELGFRIDDVPAGSVERMAMARAFAQAYAKDRGVHSARLTLIAEVGSWEQRRNHERARIKWLFTVDRAREKLGPAYPTPSIKHRRRPALAA